MQCGMMGCPLMGYDADQSNARGKFYLKTRASEPYCGKFYLRKTDALCQNAVEPQWLEHLCDHGNSFETWVVRATEG